VPDAAWLPSALGVGWVGCAVIGLSFMLGRSWPIVPFRDRALFARSSRPTWPDAGGPFGRYR